MAANLGDSQNHVVRIRGVPWSCSREDIKKFFSDCTIKNDLAGIHFAVSNDGKPSGEAYIELVSLKDVEAAKKKNRQYIGSRYIEVFESSQTEMDQCLNGISSSSNGSNPKRRKTGGGGPRNGSVPFGGTMAMFEEPFDDLFLRLRGLPFNCKIKDLQKFFDGIEIAPNGIKMPLDRQYKSLGEAFIQFATISDADKAMSKHKEKIGYRYIEVFRSSSKEFHSVFEDGPMPFQMPFPPPFQGPPSPWMDGFGPRMGPPGPPPGIDYPPRSRSPFYRNQWGPNHPPHNPYGEFGPPPPRGREPPFFDNFLPPWSQQAPQHEFAGPAKSRHTISRPSPYDRPAPYVRPPDNYYNKPQGNSKNDEIEDSLPLASLPLTYGSNHFVFVHGLPPNVRESDLIEFFNSPGVNVKPTFIKLIYDDFGRANEAKVEFVSHQDAVKAMQKDKAIMFDRSVDLFLCSKDRFASNPQTSNGSNEKNDSDTRQPAPPPSSHSSLIGTNSQVYGSNYSYMPPSNNPASAIPPPPPPTEEKSYSFYGMVPSGWRSEFSVPTSQSATGSYSYGYSNPYYSYGPQAAGYGYGNYNAATAVSGSEHTIRKEPINYASH